MDAILDYRTNQTPYRGVEELIKRWQQQTLERDKHPDAPSDNDSPHLTEAERPARARTKKGLSSHPSTGYGDRSSDGMTILPPSEETTSSLAMHRILQRDNPFNTIRKDLRRGSDQEDSSGDEIDSTRYSILEPSPGRWRGKRSSSAGSAGSCGSDASGNSDPKSLTANLPDFYETSKVGMHWRRGGEILSRLKKTRQSGSVLYLDLTIEYLALATRKMNLNAKAWSAMGKTLSRHSNGLGTGWYFLDSASHIEEYTKPIDSDTV